jgi:hypothetical protein
MSLERILIEVLGGIGAVAIVIAYYFVSHQIWSGGSLKYHLCNVGGSILVGLNALYHQALPSLVINIVWLAIGLKAIRVLKNRTDREPGTD